MKLTLCFETQKRMNMRVRMMKYNDILSKSGNAGIRMKALRYLYAATEKKGTSFNDVREKMNREIITAGPMNKIILQYLLYDILVKERKFDEAVGKFLELGNLYKGSSVEVDALVKAAMIYGLNLGDKAQARKYADMAKSLNPGHPTLLDAYAAAGISYEPWKYENKYAELREDFAAYDAPRPKEKIAVTDGEYVTVTPNPANPITTITYSIKNPSNVQLSIYSANGQKVATLVNGPMSAGTHSVTFNGAKLASGVYVYRFESAGLAKTGKLLLLK